MNIGLDLDNTIINYDNLFYQVAFENKLVPYNIKKNKISVKEFLHKKGKFENFTLIQGQIYGSLLYRAKLYRGVKSFIKCMINKGNNLYIISHKTKYPILGNKINLHEKALEFLIEHKILHYRAVKKKNIFFEESLDDKIKKILDLKIDVFIDDLPEVVTNKKLKKSTKAILIDYNKINSQGPNNKYDWISIQRELYPVKSHG